MFIQLIKWESFRVKQKITRFVSKYATLNAVSANESSTKQTWVCSLVRPSNHRCWPLLLSASFDKNPAGCSYSPVTSIDVGLTSPRPKENDCGRIVLGIVEIICNNAVTERTAKFWNTEVTSRIPSSSMVQTCSGMQHRFVYYFALYCEASKRVFSSLFSTSIF